MASTKFAAFNIVDTAYKEINGTPVPVSLIIPKNIPVGRRKVIVRWRGGGLITGHRLYPDWFADWVLNLAIQSNAIIISPDYRLLPESNGLDVLQDLKNFYQWLFGPGNLKAHLPSEVEPDVQDILVMGESAGGWAALQSGFLAESKDRVRAIVAQYAMIDLRDPHYTQDYRKEMFDPPMPQLDRSILRDHLASMKPGEIVTSGMPPDRLPLVVSALQQGKYGEFLGSDSSLYPVQMLEKVDRVPPTWLIHGKDDNIVPIEGTYKYAARLKKLHPNVRVHTSYRPGNHGFDGGDGGKLDDGWVREGTDSRSEFWLNS